MSAEIPVPVWSCEFAQAPGAPALDALTVGAKFNMKCKGEIPVEWNQNPLQLVFKEQDQAFTLALLQAVQLDPNKAEFIVTGYKAGKHNPEYFRVLQGQSGFEVLKPAWEIKSVLKQEEQPKPFPPYGPWQLSLPVWFLASVGIFLALVALIVFRIVRRRLQRKRMLEELARHKTALSPLHQSYRDARQLRRRMHGAKTAEELKLITEDLNKDFRLYVLRQYEIPTLDWSDGDILKDLRKRHRKVYRQACEPLKKTLRELLRLKAREQVLLPDLEQLHRMSLDAAERLENARGAGR